MEILLNYWIIKNFLHYIYQKLEKINLYKCNNKLEFL